MSEPTGLWLEPDKCRDLSDHLADVLCWFSGFSAAYAKGDCPDLPPSLDDLRTLNFKLKKAY